MRFQLDLGHLHRLQGLLLSTLQVIASLKSYSQSLTPPILHKDYIKFENNTKISGLVGQPLDEFLVHRNQRFASFKPSSIFFC